MIQLIEAPPRSGKSYFAVNYLCGFTKFDDLYQEYILDSNVLIISNIEGLKINHWTLNKCLDLKPTDKLSMATKDKILEFFSIENFERIMKKTNKNHIILAIDEVHELFPSGFKELKVYEFFAYHGHIGLDIIFMTQGIESMSRMFNPLLEFIVKATPRSKKISKTFSYKYCDLKGKYLFSKVIRCKQNVFRAYKSFRKDENNKPRSALMVWAVMIVSMFVIAGVLFNFSLNNIKKSSSSSKTERVGELREKYNQENGYKSGEPSGVDTVAPVVPVQPVVAPAVPVVPVWSVVDVQGYFHQGGIETYIIKNKFVQHSRYFRNFDFENFTVEFYGKPEVKRGGDHSPDLLPEVGQVEVSRLE